MDRTGRPSGLSATRRTTATSPLPAVATERSASGNSQLIYEFYLLVLDIDQLLKVVNLSKNITNI